MQAGIFSVGVVEDCTTFGGQLGEEVPKGQSI